MKKDKYNREFDDFSERIKQKLQHHTMPVDQDVWRKIEKRINPPKRIIPIWLYPTVAVAAGLALLFSVGNFFYLQDTALPVSEEIAEHQTETQQFAVTVEQPVQETPTTVKNRKHIKPRTKTVNPVIFSIPNEQELSSKETQVLPNHQSQRTREIENESASKEAQHKNDSKKTDAGKNKSLQETNKSDWTTKLSSKKQRKVLLAASLGSGVAGSSATMSARSRAYRSAELINIPTVTTVLAPQDFRQKEYLPPFSIGLNARFPVFNRLSVESGLVYTYLQTRLSNSTFGDYRAEMNLHYLGVPLNLVWTLLKERKWEIYVSGGMMLEKGIRSEFKQFQNWDNVLIKTEANKDIDGVQWSLNTSLGVGYLLGRNVSLFFDPKLSYFFESDQPYSIRKEMPLLISLNAGIRMSF